MSELRDLQKLRELRKVLRSRQDPSFEFVASFSLSDLLKGVNRLNDLVEELYLPEDSEVVLKGLEYKVVGWDGDSGDVLLEVSGFIEDDEFLDEIFSLE